MGKKSTTTPAGSTESEGLTRLLRQHGCGSIQFTGADNTLYERHLVSDNCSDATKEEPMPDPSKQLVAVFVDRSCRQWIVRDPEGNFWTLPSVELPWEKRQPYQPTAETELEPVPGHYKDMLRLPF